MKEDSLFNLNKVYIDVLESHKKDGSALPKEMIWEDGRRYVIDQVTDTRRRASLKAGGVGIRYTCIIGGRQSYLFQEADRWFVERKIRRRRQAVPARPAGSTETAAEPVRASEN